MTVYDAASTLPDITTLRDRCRALAMLEAIISPEPEFRYYSYVATWAMGTDLAAMNNGEGEEYSIVFSAAGTFIRGFDHESPMSPAGHDNELWPGLIRDIPAVFLPQVNESAFGYDGVLSATFCLWRQSTDERWHTGVIEFPALFGNRIDPDGSGMLSILCDSTPDSYVAFATDYYDVDLDVEAVAHVWALQPLDNHVVSTLNADLTVSDVAAEAAIIGYPTAGG